MKANIFKTLSNRQEAVELCPGKTIAESLPEYDTENAVIIVNGKVESQNYKINENDIITIRLMPAGGVAAIVTIIVVAVVAVAAGVVGGIIAYKKKLAAQKAQQDLEKTKKEANNPELDNRPFLRGASNTDAKGNLVPFVCGYNFFTPYKLSTPFYKLTGTDGADEYTYTALLCGFNKQVIKKIAIEDITIKTFDDVKPQEGSYSIDASVFAEDGLIEIAQDGLLLQDLPELNYKTESNACNDEIPRDSSVEKGNSEYLTYTLDPYAKNIEIAITFPYGLHAYNDDNVKISTTVTITPQYSLDGGKTWTDFVFNNNGVMTNTFTRNVNDKELRFVARKDFTLQDYKTLHNNEQTAIYIRVRSNGNEHNQIKNNCYVLYYQSICFDPNKSSSPAGIVKDNEEAGLVPASIEEDRERAFCTVLGLKLKATKLNEEKLKKINIITNGIARVWNGTEWNTEKQPTRNPAAWALEIETSDRHPASRRSDNELDLESFGDYYEHCESKGYKFDYLVTQNTKKDTLLQYIMESTGACIYYDIQGRRAVAFDRPQENALAVYNPQNIISISNKKNFGRRTDGLRIKYNSSDNDLFKEETYVVMREVDGVPLEMTDDSIIKDITVTGITTHQHVVKYARRLMAIEILRPKTTTIEVGNEGIFYTPYSKILIQDDSLKIGIGKGFVIQDVGYIGNKLSLIYIDNKLTFEEGKSYGIIVNCYDSEGMKPLAVKVRGEGTTDTLIVVSDISATASLKPEVNCIFSFGELDENGDFTRITTEYVINQIKRSEKGFSIDLVNYNVAIYETGTIPEYRSNITQKPVSKPAEIPADYVTYNQMQQVIDNLESGNIPIGKPDMLTLVYGTAHRDNITLSCSHNTDGLRNDLRSIVFTITKPDGTTATVLSSGRTATYTFDRTKDGYPEKEDLQKWRVKANATNVYGKTSEDSEEHAVIVTAYGTWQVTQPAVVTRVSDRTITLLLNATARADNKQIYGTLRYKVQVKRPDIDTAFFKPNSGGNPYPDENSSNELNYKLASDTGYIEADGIYSQTMPLKGQSNDEIVDTAYIFRVVLYNEASESEPVEATATALCTSIRDLVKANETAKEAYITQLSALSANVGTIYQGAFGRNLNYWDLSTFLDEAQNQHYEGAFRVGGEKQYLQVEPIVSNGIITDYNIKFIVGAFELSATASNINGELIIQHNANSLDRTRITPNGTFFQHLNGVEGDWQNIAYIHTNGHFSSQFFSDGNVYFTNQTMSQRRISGYDIGAPMPSANSRVFHFDENLLDQHGENGLIITDAENGDHLLVGAAESSDDLDCTPAILAVSPYATIGKSLYGQYSLLFNAGAATNYTVDFWIQYIFSENQVLFNVGTQNEKVRLVQGNGECYLYELEDNVCPMFEEMMMSRLFYQLEFATVCAMYADEADICPMFENDSAMFDNRDPLEPYHHEWIYYTKVETEEGEVFERLETTEEFQFFENLENIWIRTCEFNEPRGGYEELQHVVNNSVVEVVTLAEVGVAMESNEWVHFGIIADAEKLCVCIDSTSTCFDRVEFSGALSVSLSENKNSFMLDELLIDTAAALDKQTFFENAVKRIPYGTLDESQKWFVLSAHDVNKVKTNLFDTPNFKAAVEAIIAEHL
ncbi:MAG: hypothetical protein MJ196_06070 [Treponemataceae bacterium]|nr:hypothetical protein [Treponemataceae bacterium]